MVSCRFWFNFVAIPEDKVSIWKKSILSAILFSIIIRSIYRSMSFDAENLIDYQKGWILMAKIRNDNLTNGVLIISEGIIKCFPTKHLRDEGGWCGRRDLMKRFVLGDVFNHRVTQAHQCVNRIRIERKVIFGK